VKIFVDGARAGGGSIVLSADDMNSGNDLVAKAASARQTFAYTQDQLAAQIARIQINGFPVMLHCLSDEGVELVTAAVEDVRRLKVGQELNHRIEHWKPPAGLWDRMRDASLYFSIVANHPGFNPEWGQSLNTPYKSYVDRGLKPVLISDRCGGYRAPVRPLYSITRACLSVEDGGEATPGNELHFDDALKMWTLWAAESTHQLIDRGTISVGKLGDMVLLSDDPASMSSRELLDLAVEATILGGKVVHQRGGNPQLCSST
jgi:predicted amidohydrolase YtcJ